MKTYNHLSQEWLVEPGQMGPSACLRRLVETVGENLSPDNLGHVKGYAAWPGGEAFASTTCNGRDFYPQGMDIYDQARKERAEAFAALDEALNKI